MTSGPATSLSECSFAEREIPDIGVRATRRQGSTASKERPGVRLPLASQKPRPHDYGGHPQQHRAQQHSRGE